MFFNLVLATLKVIGMVLVACFWSLIAIAIVYNLVMWFMGLWS